VSLVQALGGHVQPSDATEWLAPRYRSPDRAQATDGERSAKVGERVREVFRVARDLNLLVVE
jgi:hypothetical protein